jgi:NitT/TauT family transport system permease protein
MTPLSPIVAGAQVALGIAFFVLFVVAWSVATFGGFVPKTFLADPGRCCTKDGCCSRRFGFAKDVGITIWRVLGGFILAAAVGVPLGIAMGAYKPIEAFFEPFVSFARYLPASAVHSAADPVGRHRRAAEAPRHLHRSFFQIVLMVAVTVGSTRAISSSGVYARRRIRRHRPARPAAERCAFDRRDAAARARLGVDLRDRRRADRRVKRHRPHDHRQPGAAQHRQIIFGIILIGIVGLISDLSFKQANRALFPWAIV